MFTHMYFSDMGRAPLKSFAPILNHYRSEDFVTEVAETRDEKREEDRWSIRSIFALWHRYQARKAADLLMARLDMLPDHILADIGLADSRVSTDTSAPVIHEPLEPVPTWPIIVSITAKPRTEAAGPAAMPYLTPVQAAITSDIAAR